MNAIKLNKLTLRGIEYRVRKLRERRDPDIPPELLTLFDDARLECTDFDITARQLSAKDRTDRVAAARCLNILAEIESKRPSPLRGKITSDPKTRPAIASALADADIEVQVYVARALAHFPFLDFTQIAPTLVNHLQHEVQDLQIASAEALSSYAPDLASAYTVEIASLFSSPLPNVRTTACRCLARFGNSAHPAFGELQKHFQHEPEVEVRDAILNTLLSIDPEGIRLQAIENEKLRRSLAAELRSRGQDYRPLRLSLEQPRLPEPHESWPAYKKSELARVININEKTLGKQLENGDIPHIMTSNGEYRVDPIVLEQLKRARSTRKRSKKKSGE